jgi:hypothetical protein
MALQGVGGGLSLGGGGGGGSMDGDFGGVLGS